MGGSNSKQQQQNNIEDAADGATAANNTNKLRDVKDGVDEVTDAVRHVPEHTRDTKLGSVTVGYDPSSTDAANSEKVKKDKPLFGAKLANIARTKYPAGSVTVGYDPSTAATATANCTAAANNNKEKDQGQEEPK